MEETTDVSIQSQQIKKSKLKRNIFYLVILFGIIAIGIFFVYKKQQDLPQTSSKLPSKSSNSPSSKNVTNTFFKKGVNEIPLQKIVLSNLPNSKDIRGITTYEEHIWFAGDGSLIEFDPQNREIVQFSDPTLANCDKNLVIIKDYLYIPCYILQESLQGKDEQGYPVYGIYKISLLTNQVEKVFTKKDGLLNQSNYMVHNDDPYIWLETFEGAARIDTRDDSIRFFRSELGIEGTSFGIGTIVVDKDYVWVNVNANSYSKGGLSLFNKKTETWTAFGPKELRDDNHLERIDLEWNKSGSTIKKISGGIQIAFRENETNSADKLVEKQYSYITGQWTRLSTTRNATGPESVETGKYLDKEYVSVEEHSKNDENGFTQIYDASAQNTKYIVNGRAFLWISDIVNTKRYLVTSSSIDVLTPELKFPKILINTMRDIDSSRPHPTNPEIKIYHPKGGTALLVIDPNFAAGFEGPDYWGTARVWVVDTTIDKVIKEFSTDIKYEWRQDGSYKATIENGNIFLQKEKGEKILEFNTQTKEFTIIDTKLAEIQSENFSSH